MQLPKDEYSSTKTQIDVNQNGLLEYDELSNFLDNKQNKENLTKNIDDNKKIGIFCKLIIDCVEQDSAAGDKPMKYIFDRIDVLPNEQKVNFLKILHKTIHQNYYQTDHAKKQYLILTKGVHQKIMQGFQKSNVDNKFCLEFIKVITGRNGQIDNSLQDIDTANSFLVYLFKMNGIYQDVIKNQSIQSEFQEFKNNTPYSVIKDFEQIQGGDFLINILGFNDLKSIKSEDNFESLSIENQIKILSLAKIQNRIKNKDIHNTNFKEIIQNSIIESSTQIDNVTIRVLNNILSYKTADNFNFIGDKKDLFDLYQSINGNGLWLSDKTILNITEWSKLGVVLGSAVVAGIVMGIVFPPSVGVSGGIISTIVGASVAGTVATGVSHIVYPKGYETFGEGFKDIFSEWILNAGLGALFAGATASVLKKLSGTLSENFIKTVVNKGNGNIDENIIQQIVAKNGGKISKQTLNEISFASKIPLNELNNIVVETGSNIGGGLMALLGAEMGMGAVDLFTGVFSEWGRQKFILENKEENFLDMLKTGGILFAIGMTLGHSGEVMKLLKVKNKNSVQNMQEGILFIQKSLETVEKGSILEENLNSALKILLNEGIQQSNKDILISNNDKIKILQKIFENKSNKLSISQLEDMLLLEPDLQTVIKNIDYLDSLYSQGLITRWSSYSDFLKLLKSPGSLENMIKYKDFFIGESKIDFDFVMRLNETNRDKLFTVLKRQTEIGVKDDLIMKSEMIFQYDMPTLIKGIETFKKLQQLEIPCSFRDICMNNGIDFDKLIVLKKLGLKIDNISHDLVEINNFDLNETFLKKINILKDSQIELNIQTLKIINSIDLENITDYSNLVKKGFEISTHNIGELTKDNLEKLEKLIDLYPNIDKKLLWEAKRIDVNDMDLYLELNKFIPNNYNFKGYGIPLEEVFISKYIEHKINNPKLTNSEILAFIQQTPAYQNKLVLVEKFLNDGVSWIINQQVYDSIKIKLVLNKNFDYITKSLHNARIRYNGFNLMGVIDHLNTLSNETLITNFIKKLEWVTNRGIKINSNSDFKTIESIDDFELVKNYIQSNYVALPDNIAVGLLCKISKIKNNEEIGLYLNKMIKSSNRLSKKTNETFTIEELENIVLSKNFDKIKNYIENVNDALFQSGLTLNPSMLDNLDMMINYLENKTTHVPKDILYGLFLKASKIENFDEARHYLDNIIGAYTWLIFKTTKTYSFVQLDQIALGRNFELIKQYVDKSSNISQDIFFELMLKFVDNEYIFKNPEKIGEVITVYTKLFDSKIPEIVKIRAPLFDLFLDLDNPIGVYDKIENIFIKNNLPEIGKIFKIFDLLYSKQRINSFKNFRTSPVLGSMNSDRLFRYTIFKDLLNINIKSGNRSLKEYLQIICSGKELIKKVETNNHDFEILSKDEKEKLFFIFQKLNTLYENSNLPKQGESNITGTIDSHNLSNMYNKLASDLDIKQGQSIIDRIGEMFIKPLGLISFDDLFILMEKSIQDSQQRGINYLNTGRKVGNDIYLDINEGDLLKGINAKYIGEILQRGSVAKEFLGRNADSDSTPFDTDVAKILPGQGTDFSSKLNNSMAIGYGDIVFVIKERGQFYNSTKENYKDYDSSKLELFETGGGQHYGIRTGFPTTEIDMIIINNTLSEKMLQNVFFEIAQNGFYIPIVDSNGKVVFSFDMYNKYRDIYKGIKKFGNDEYDLHQTPKDSKLLEIVKQETPTIQQINEIGEKSMHRQKYVQNILEKLGVKFKSKHDKGLLGADLSDTGSSGRGTCFPKDVDYDFVITLDSSDFEKLNIIKAELDKELGTIKSVDSGGNNNFYQFRSLENNKGLPLDILFVKKGTPLEYASHDAIADRLLSIKQKYGEEKYNEVIGNILAAKKILKESGIYKKFVDGEKVGGIGGIGVENWILNNKGNIYDAFKSFVQAAYLNGNRISLEEFKTRYSIFDPGCDLRSGNHDNFINFLTQDSYIKFLDTIERYIH